MPSKTCIGERCWCGALAAKKVGEEIAIDDPTPHRHNLTSYICAAHYAQLMGPLGAEQVGVEALRQPPSDAIRNAAEWKEHHENLLEVRQQDITVLQAKIDSLEAQLKFKNEAMELTKGCPGKIVVENGFYRLKCYKSKHNRALAQEKHDV